MLLSVRTTPPVVSASVASNYAPVLVLLWLVVGWRGVVPAAAMVGVVTPVVLV